MNANDGKAGAKMTIAAMQFPVDSPAVGPLTEKVVGPQAADLSTRRADRAQPNNTFDTYVVQRRERVCTAPAHWGQPLNYQFLVQRRR